MGQVAEDTNKIKAFINRCIAELEVGEYARVVSGYASYKQDGSEYDRLFQENADRIVSKLSSLGYKYTTRHGHGCREWNFFKEIPL